MAVGRRRRTQRPAKRPELPRVLKVTSTGQWEKLLAKLGNRLLLIHFSAPWAAPSQQMRPYINDIAKRPQFSHVVFAEIEVDQLSELAKELGVEACPTMVAWKDGACVEMSKRGEGASPQKLVELLDRHAGPKPSQPRWKGLLGKAALVVTAVAAAALAFQQAQQRQRQTSPGKTAALDDQIKALRASLTLATRRRQSKIVQQLQTQLESLSRERAEIDMILQTATAGSDEEEGTAPSHVYSSGDEERVVETAAAAGVSDSDDDGLIEDDDSDSD